VALLHQPLVGLPLNQISAVCSRLAARLAELSPLVKKNTPTSTGAAPPQVCLVLADDTAGKGAEEGGQEATCEAVRRLLSKGVTVDSVCQRLSLAKTCLEDLKTQLRGKKCDMGTEDITPSERSAEHFEDVCVDTVSKLHATRLTHSVEDTAADMTELLFWNRGDGAVMLKCSNKLGAVFEDSKSICMDLAVTFVVSKSRFAPGQWEEFCGHYYNWIQNESKQQQPKMVTATATPSPVFGDTKSYDVSIRSVGTDHPLFGTAAPTSATPTSFEKVQALPDTEATKTAEKEDQNESEKDEVEKVVEKAQAAKKEAENYVKHEADAKVVAEKITEKAVAVKLDAEAIEQKENAAKKEADQISKKASIAKADADAIAKRAIDAQIDAQKIAEKASDAQQDVQKIARSAKDATKDANDLLNKAKMADALASHISRKAAEATQVAEDEENKVTEVKTKRVKKESIPMSSWTLL